MLANTHVQFVLTRLLRGLESPRCDGGAGWAWRCTLPFVLSTHLLSRNAIAISLRLQSITRGTPAAAVPRHTPHARGKKGVFKPRFCVAGFNCHDWQKSSLHTQRSTRRAGSHGCGTPHIPSREVVYEGGRGRADDARRGRGQRRRRAQRVRMPRRPRPGASR